MRVFTIGHGRRPGDELVAMLHAAAVRTLIDVRRFPASRWNPQFNRAALAEAVGQARIDYVHLVELGGRRSNEPGEDRYSCLRQPAFRAYAARMGRKEWQAALAEALAYPEPALLCAETRPADCHRRLIADLLHARGHDVVHLLSVSEAQSHVLSPEAEIRDGKLFLCGSFVA